MTKSDKWMQKAREIWEEMGFINDRLNQTPILARALEAAAEAEKNRIGELLKDPAFVNANIMRGGIVLPSNYVRTTDTDGPYKAALEATDKAARAEERERCAVYIEQRNGSIPDRQEIAAAIRKGAE